MRTPTLRKGLVFPDSLALLTIRPIASRPTQARCCLRSSYCPLG